MSLALLLALALAAADGSSVHLQSRPGSLQGGETLGVGGSVAVFSAGFSTMSAAYAQGHSNMADYGAQLELDWLTTEFFAGGIYRQLTWRLGEVYVSWRARAGLYGDFGSTWATSTNRSGAGLQLAPGLALSRRFPSGILSASVDAPLDFIFSRGGGLAVGVRGSVSFETPLWGDLLVGARAGAAGLGSTGGAPFANDSPRGMIDLSVLLTYRLM
jgi:hypothetical protein